MKSSLLAVALLMSVVAKAQNAPPLQPIQIVPAAAVIKPVAAAKPAAAVNSTSDEEALRKLRQAEAEFKARKTVTVAPVIVTPVVPSTSDKQQLPSIRRAAPVVRAAPRAQAPIAPIARASSLDAASLVASHCASSNHPLRCMNIELNEAELRVDSAEVRLLNCREIRKFDASLDRNVIDALVTGRMYQLRFKETQAFNAQLAKVGQASKMKTKELELRATLSHLNAVSELNAKVCNASDFAKLYAEAQASN